MNPRTNSYDCHMEVEDAFWFWNGWIFYKI
jgi:hypothetical protein